MEILENFRSTSLTFPMILVGTLLGSLVCAANMYFGMQVGSVNTMSPSTALISFAIFKSSDHWLGHVFTPTENVVVQTIASSIAGTPIAASMLSVIPAFEFLRGPKEGGHRHFSVTELIVWSLGVSLFGTVFAAPFRRYFLLRQRLRFPGGFATGVLIGALHNDSETAHIADLDKRGLSSMGSPRSIDPAPADANDAVDAALPDLSETPSHFWQTGSVTVILKAFSGTAIYVSSAAQTKLRRHLTCSGVCLILFSQIKCSSSLWTCRR